MQRVVGSFLLGVVAIGSVGCASSGDDRRSARDAYCNSAKLDFGRLIRMATDANTEPRDRDSARSILAVFARNGDDWMQGSPPRLRPDSRVILRASRSAALGDHVPADAVALGGPLLRVRLYSMRCRG